MDPYPSDTVRRVTSLAGVVAAAALAATLMAGAVPPAGRIAAPLSAAPASAPVYGYRVVRSYPHDPQAFTQGLTYHEGFLYEGTGLVGRSSIRKVRLETGEVLQIRHLAEPYFGEGIAIWQDSLIQLTWRSEIGFVHDLATFEPRRTFRYTGEGWGLTHDGTRLIMSDGSATGTLRLLDPATFRESGRLTVRDGGIPVKGLNELEFVKGEIYANVWNTDRIARISPKTGQVTGWIDLRGLLDPREAAGVDVLNGIAYDAAADRLFVTGKLWPRLFEIQLVPRRAAADLLSWPVRPRAGRE
jgi:glutaminyl-peptide cyclotransferase